VGTSPKAVLLVVADPRQLTAYARALASAGIHVDAAVTFHEARSLLVARRPQVLVTPVRLGEYNGLHLALWGTSRVPHLRCVIIGHSDPSLERYARELGFLFVRQEDHAAVVQATFEALAREGPRRRWHRTPLVPSVSARVNGSPAAILDISYGGFRAETALHVVAVEPGRDVVVDIPRFAVRTEAMCRWVRRGISSDAQRWGASLTDRDLGLGSSWRVAVDRLSAASRVRSGDATAGTPTPGDGPPTPDDDPLN
jgi:hypothetical protein